MLHELTTLLPLSVGEDPNFQGHFERGYAAMPSSKLERWQEWLVKGLEGYLGRIQAKQQDELAHLLFVLQYVRDAFGSSEFANCEYKLPWSDALACPAHQLCHLMGNMCQDILTLSSPQQLV